MIALPPDLELRAANEGDLGRVVALLIACDLEDAGRLDTDEADVLAQWERTGFDLARDTRVVVVGRAASETGQAGTSEAGQAGASEASVAGELAGYANVFEEWAEVFVHPQQRGRGVGTVLRIFTEERKLEQAHRLGAQGPVKLDQAPRAANTGAHRLLEAAGYRRGHEYAQMEVELTDVPAPVRWPPGVAVRRFEPGRDERRVHELENESWHEYPTYVPETFERWSDKLREPDFDPSLWLLAEHGVELVGISLCRRWGDMGWVATLGVRPDRRRRGLGEALLRHSFAELRRRGAQRVGLSVSSRSTADAWKLYERVGMRRVGGWLFFEKRLDVG